MSNGAGSRYSIEEAATGRQDEKRAGWSWWYLLFLIQFIAVLWPPFYNMAEPDLIGIPFFYWYQLLWVFIAAGACYLAYVLLRREARGDRARQYTTLTPPAGPPPGDIVDDELADGNRKAED